MAEHFAIQELLPPLLQLMKIHLITFYSLNLLHLSQLAIVDFDTFNNVAISLQLLPFFFSFFAQIPSTMILYIYFGSRLADLHLVLPNEVPQLCC